MMCKNVMSGVGDDADHSLREQSDESYHRLRKWLKGMTETFNIKHIVWKADHESRTHTPRTSTEIIKALNKGHLLWQWRCQDTWCCVARPYRDCTRPPHTGRKREGAKQLKGAMHPRKHTEKVQRGSSLRKCVSAQAVWFAGLRHKKTRRAHWTFAK